MDMSDLISVIVPIYNAEEYIGGCIESVVAQTYKNIELLLIDDGSEDNSRDICQNMSIEDKRIKVYSQKHQGVSAARNAGMEVSKGRYLFFLDADDIIHPQLLKTLYSLLEESGAVIATESRYYASGGAFCKPEEWKIESEGIKKNYYLNHRKAIRSLIYGERDAALYVMGGKMVRREITKSIHFDERLSHGEDTLFLYQLLEKGADVVVLCRNWYYYRMYDQSATSVFTVPACKSRYEAERYIRNQEIRAGRMPNAFHWEGAIVRAIMAWYDVGRSRRDGNLITYVKDLAEHEKSLKIFSKINRFDKIRFYLKFYYYPIYYAFHVIYSCVCSVFFRRLYKLIRKRRW